MSCHRPACAPRCADGDPDTKGGLYLEARDLARIGHPYLNDGVGDGARILPAGWAGEATSRHVARLDDRPNAPGYGYQWWRYDRRGTDVWAGNGFGGASGSSSSPRTASSAS